MKTIRKRLTYANVMSTIALFLVLAGGAAYAAPWATGASARRSSSRTL